MKELAITNEGRPVRLTVETRVVPMSHHRAGLQWNATGYGARIPSMYMARIGNAWHRVYIACFSNAGTAYIEKAGLRFIVQD